MARLSLFALVGMVLVGCSESPCESKGAKVNYVLNGFSSYSVQLDTNGNEMVTVTAIRDERSGRSWLVYDPSKITSVEIAKAVGK